VVRKRKQTASEALEAIRTYRQTFVMAEIDAPLVEVAIRLHQKFPLRYWDALIVATARQCQCETILSTDLNDDQNFDGLRVLNLFRGASFGETTPAGPRSKLTISNSRARRSIAGIRISTFNRRSLA
jgi:PIN domain